MDKMLKGFTILYIEDELTIHNELLSILLIFGLKVISAKNGKEGLQKFKKFNKKIKIVLTDIKMPKMDGLTMISEIRKLNKNVYIIITTAYNDTDFLQKSINLGVNNYLSKPINIFILKDTLRKAIEPILFKNKLIKKNKKIKKEIKKNKEKHNLLLRQSRFASMGEMIDIIAHQWRQPLSSINISSDHIKYKLQSNQFQIESIEKDFIIKKLNSINGYINNLSSTIDDFRTFYDLDKKSLLLPINQVIESSITLLNISFNLNKIIIKRNFTSNKKIVMYKNEIVHVFISILKNCEENFLIKKIENKTINIETIDTLAGIEINISDNGKGINNKNIDSIFDPYFTTKKSIKGIGLGLYLSKIIIEKSQKGKIFANNTEEGISFVISLKNNFHE